jgi:hypothetical protein
VKQNAKNNTFAMSLTMLVLDNRDFFEPTQKTSDPHGKRKEQHPCCGVLPCASVGKPAACSITRIYIRALCNSVGPACQNNPHRKRLYQTFPRILAMASFGLCAKSFESKKKNPTIFIPNLAKPINTSTTTRLILSNEGRSAKLVKQAQFADNESHEREMLAQAEVNPKNSHLRRKKGECLHTQTSSLSLQKFIRLSSYRERIQQQQQNEKIQPQLRSGWFCQ